MLGMLALGRPAFSQSAPELASAINAAQQQYTASFAGLPQLYNGPEYVDYAKRYQPRTGHQFFLWPDKQSGSVYYNGQAFGNLQLAYDVVLDQVVLSQPTSPLLLRLIPEKLEYFTLNNHRFRRLVADSASSRVIRTGFYEVLVDSSVQVLAKRAKRLQERIVTPNIAVEFTATDRLFMQKGGSYYAIKRKSNALRLFADKNKEMQKFIQQNKQTLNKLPLEASIVQLTRYYCSLPQ
ncbi:hypothetical protein Q3A66_14315 [Hymenobacter sp. BT770]|uniref:hypothetical protein n=2 Tax=Hymenobacter sp. BT770 TaxID=2886942 RepID=UPI002673E481|nr:hypothetical protein [Hymenobacter sp. BT770]MDO3416241.1 hypothetical protein [Hymenobacter sp. BT770]